MKDQEFRKQMVSLKTDSLVVEAKQYEKEKNYKECGISFVAAAETIPDHKDHAQRLYNAGLCFQNARLIGQAIKVARGSSSPTTRKTRWPSGRCSRSRPATTSWPTTRRRPSATRSSPSSSRARSRRSRALGNAYSFRIGLGEFEKAIEDMNASSSTTATRSRRTRRTSCSR